VVAYGLARIIPGLVSVLALAIYTRILTREQYGTYTLVVAGVGLVYAVAFQWLSLGVLRLVKSLRWTQALFLSSVLQCYGAALGLTAIVATGFMVFRLLAAPHLIAIGCLLLAVQVWLELNIALSIAESDPAGYARLTGVRAVVALGLGTGLGWAGFGTGGVLVGVAGGYLAAGLWGASRWWKGARWDGGSQEVRRALMRYGFPLTLTYLLDYVVSTSDRVLLGALRGAEAAGTYSAAYDLCQQAIWALMVVLTQSAYPQVVEAFERDGIAGARLPLRRHGILLAAIAIPGATGLAVLAPSITGVVLPASYSAETRAVVPLIAFAVLLGGLKAYYFDFSFQLGHRTVRQLAAAFAAATTNLLLNLLWIPRLGALGAAYATLMAYAVGLLTSWVLGRRIVAIPIPVREWVGVAVASAGMGILLWPVRGFQGVGALVGQIVLGGTGYLVLLLLGNVSGVRATAREAWRKLRSSRN
jgi:O-antigen/teichoic acid export membrane protein